MTDLRRLAQAMVGRPLIERLMAMVDKSGECWIFQGSSNGRGYGSLSVGSRERGTLQRVLVHRFAYETLVGPIPAGMQIDHLCYNRLCVRPEHLRAATHSENQQNRSGVNRNSTTGVRGVSFIPAKQPKRPYRVQVVSNGVITIESFATLDEASRRASELRRELHTPNTYRDLIGIGERRGFFA